MLTQLSKKRKAQSAMEYLMTYGWAILIIAVVLGALFSLGVFSGNALLGNACVAQSGYLCQTPTYFHGTIAVPSGSGAAPGNILVTVGQNTGTSWVTANFIFIAQGTPGGNGGVPALNFNAFASGGGGGLANSIVGGLTTGQTIPIYLPVTGASGVAITSPVAAGTSATGSVWVQYTTSTGGPLQYSQVAAINIKAT